MPSDDCVCDEINTRHCPVHGQGDVPTTRRLCIATIQGVLELMDSAGRAGQPTDHDGITTYSNGYGLWFIDPHKRASTKPLTAEEIMERIEARAKVKAQRD